MIVILGILSMTSMLYMCPKLTDDSPSLIYCGRLVLAYAQLLTDFIQCCNVTNSVVPFFPFQGFCRCYKSGATTTVITVFIRFVYAA